MEKRYHIEIVSRHLTERCTTLTGKIRAKDRNGQTTSTPGTAYYPAEADIDFRLAEGRCEIRVIDTDSGMAKGKFIITNLSKEALDVRRFDYSPPADLSNVTPIYGGIGNKVEVEIYGERMEFPIEPVGVIVLAIDGLRQDVLYPHAMQDVNDPYGNYYVDPNSLAGLGQVLRGNPQDTASQSYVMLPKVTAIFPSITYASWASIFTGKQAGETGIMGNEFFARDLITYDAVTQAYKWKNTIPAMGRNPEGMVTISEGSFPRNIWEHEAMEPSSGKWEDSPQNNLLQASTLYETLSVNTAFKKYHQSLGGKSSVVVFQHYARGADKWVTVDLDNLVFFGIPGFFKIFSESYLLDKIPAHNALKWLNYNLLTEIEDTMERSDRPFPGVFTVYFAGLDHEAHDKGMSGYTKFFKETTDDKIRDVIKWLKDYEEFDNKIFIIVADHGMTAMPTFGKVTLYLGTEDERDVTADTSCKLTVDKFNKRNVQDSEKTNNNLHIWELGEVMKAAGIESGLNYKVLVPKEIAVLYKSPGANGQLSELPHGATDILTNANVIAALNGPMAHIYLRSNNNWQTIPGATELGYLAIVFKRMLQEGGVILDEKVKNKFPRLLSSVDKILMRINEAYKVFKGFDEAGNVITEELTTLSGSEYIKSLQRIEGLNNLNRSGDIILIFRDYTNDIPENRFTSGVACKSWHGSLNPSDSYVPLIATYPGGNKFELEPIIQSDTICPNGQCDGNWKVTNIILEMINKQYSGK